MADGMNVTPGAGVVVATDSVIDPDLGQAPMHFQYVKLVDATPNGTTKVGATTRGLKVQPAAAAISDTDRSGEITTGGQQQVLLDANPVRAGFSIQNLSTEDLWINWTGTAVATQSRPSFKIPPDCWYETPAHAVPTGIVRVIGPTTGQDFSAREW